MISGDFRWIGLLCLSLALGSEYRPGVLSDSVGATSSREEEVVDSHLKEPLEPTPTCKQQKEVGQDDRTACCCG